MNELVLVRHGEAEHLTKGIIGGWTDLPLTDRGRKQVEVTARRLKEILGDRIEIIYTSDLKRAYESAKIIRDELDVPLVVEPQLREMNMGVSQGKTREEAAKFWNPPSEPLLDYIPYPEAESWRMLRKRAALLMDRLDKKSEEVVLIVAHGNINATIIEWWFRPDKSALTYYRCHAASISWLGISDWGTRELRKLNETAHLAPMGLDDSVIGR
ncbi:MAG: histidine phosphatase family protein [Candidatus Thorarchaeota archaeon]|nr:histidine phosphatase family protein [Candidatus Thorarchaeota archaeon]